MMEMLALFFKQGDDIVVTARYPEIPDGTGMTATFYVKDDKTTPDTDSSVLTYDAEVVADPDNMNATLSQFIIPSEDTQGAGAWWWKVKVFDTLSNGRTANQGPLLIEAV
jgi:hypothetical protein